jgi:peptidoglycan/LPS O-acetylase OafA/YrhL
MSSLSRLFCQTGVRGREGNWLRSTHSTRHKIVALPVVVRLAIPSGDPDAFDPTYDIMKSRHHALDLLRGLAAFGIATYHFVFSLGFDVQSLATFGVYVFFVLSGLTMMLVYGPQFSGAISRSDLTTFYWNRISRIMPLLAAASLASLLVAAPSLGLTRHLGASALYAFLTGTALFALHLPGYLSNTIGAWSLGIEMLFYALFPVICLLITKARLWQFVATVIVLIIAQQIVIALMGHWVEEDPRRFWHYYTTPLIFAPFFFLGIAIVRSRLERREVFLLPSLLSLGAIASFSLVAKVEIFLTHWAYLVLTATSFVAVFFAFSSHVPRFLVRPSTFLGNVSYALYLTHPFTLRGSEALSDALGYGPAFVGILFFPLAIIVAHFTFVLFERPIQQVLRSSMPHRTAADGNEYGRGSHEPRGIGE